MVKMAAEMTLITGRKIRCCFIASRQAFTLIELVLVLVVAATVLAIAAPTLRGFFASRGTADAALNVLSLTRWARSQAISQGSTCRLNVDDASNTCWLSVQRAGAYVELSHELGRRFKMPEGCKISMKLDSENSESSSLRSSLGVRTNLSVRGLSGRTSSADDAGSYVQFYPTGRSDLATIEIVGRSGETFQVVCDTAVEGFRIIKPSEAKQ